MTDSQNGFKPGSFWNYRGDKVEYAGSTFIQRENCYKDKHGFYFITRESMSPWIEPPVTTASKLEALAGEIEPGAHCKDHEFLGVQIGLRREQAAQLRAIAKEAGAEPRVEYTDHIGVERSLSLADAAFVLSRVADGNLAGAAEILTKEPKVEYRFGLENTVCSISIAEAARRLKAYDEADPPSPHDAGQAVAEPVAWRWKLPDANYWSYAKHRDGIEQYEHAPVYLHPPAPQPAAETVAEPVYAGNDPDDPMNPFALYDAVIEHRKNNPEPAPQPTPAFDEAKEGEGFEEQFPYLDLNRNGGNARLYHARDTRLTLSGYLTRAKLAASQAAADKGRMAEVAAALTTLLDSSQGLAGISFRNAQELRALATRLNGEDNQVQT